MKNICLEAVNDSTTKLDIWIDRNVSRVVAETHELLVIFEKQLFKFLS